MCHHVDNANFLTYLGYIPYTILKNLGISLNWKRMKPY
jgi:hypothetical protein